MADMDNVQDHVSDDQRHALVRVIRSRPNVTLADLSALLDGHLGDVLGTITVADLLGDSEDGETEEAHSPALAGPGADGQVARAAKRRLVVSASEVDEGPAPVESRTAAGRARYDEALMQVLRDNAGEPLSAGELRNLAGGSDLQARAALQRLVDGGQVERTGKARGTRYAAVL